MPESALGQLNWADYALIAVVVLSALISVVRGFVREAVALLGWVAAVWIVLTFTAPVSSLFVEHIDVPSMRLATAAVLLFVGTLILSGLFVYLIGLLVDKTGLSGTDRMLGVVFGAARGVIIAAVLVTLAGLTPMPRDPWWQQSVLLPHLEQVAVRLRALLPEDLSSHIDFSTGTQAASPAPPSTLSPVLNKESRE